jgi:hypothetical protein
MEFADGRRAKPAEKSDEKKADAHEPVATSRVRFVATATLPVETGQEGRFTVALNPVDTQGIASVRVLAEESMLPRHHATIPTPDANATSRLDPAPFRNIIVNSLVEAVSSATGSPEARGAVSTVLENLNPMDKIIFDAYAHYLAVLARQRPDSPVPTPQVGAQQLELLHRIRDLAISTISAD